MTDRSAPSPDEPIAIRRLATPEEYRAAEEVQRAAWGTTGAAAPAPIERAINDNGGLALGAFDGERMVGMSLGFLGREGTSLFHYSHLTGVRPEYQNRQVGWRLKCRQREEALGAGLNEIRWTFDPLQAKNAHFNVHRLGGVPDRYYPRYYGVMSDALNAGMETDRVRLRWHLASPRVVGRIEGTAPPRSEGAERWSDLSSLVETAPGSTGVRQPRGLRSPTEKNHLLEIPADLADARARDPSGARAWREAVRDAFAAAFEAGYRVEDFGVVGEGAERRAFYLLERSPRSDAD
jgi:chorismate synthase